MADKTDSAGESQLFFPFRGQNEAMSYKDQLPLTSPIIINCRPRDVNESRARGGQRPGLSKAFATQVSSAKPVLKLVMCVNTYISI